MMLPTALDYDIRGHGPAVVLIHGHPFDRSMWDPQLAVLAPYRVVTPDLRGYGRSPATTGTVTMADLAGDVWALLDRLDCERIAVVGMSMGGLVAMEMAIGRPDRVWALGLVATTADPATGEERARRRALADAVDREGMQPIIDDMAPHLFGPQPDPATVRTVLEMMRANSARGSAAALRGRAERPDYVTRLRELDVPSLVCAGTHDHWSTPDVTGRLVRCLRAPRLVTLAGAGHMPNLEQPQCFNAALVEFLADARANTLRVFGH